MVFIILTVALCGLTFAKIVDATDFIMLTGMAFSAYFRGTGANSTNTDR